MPSTAFPSSTSRPHTNPSPTPNAPSTTTTTTPTLTLQIPLILLLPSPKPPTTTHPIHTLTTHLRTTLPTLPLRAFIPGPREKKKTIEEFGPGRWIVASPGDAGYPGGEEEEEVGLSKREAGMVGKKNSGVGVVLVRRGVSGVKERERVLGELGEICRVLGACGGMELRTGFGVVCNAQCRMRVCFDFATSGPGSGAGRGDRDGREGGCSPDGVRGILAFVAGYERELLGIEGMGAVLGFAGMSRFLEWKAVREMRREKGQVWRRYGGEGMELERERERERWVRGTQVRDRVLEVVRPGIWEIVGEAVSGGEEVLGRLVRDLWEFERAVGRLGVQLGGMHGEGDTSGCSSVKSIVFQSHRACIDDEGQDMRIYISLIVQIVDYILGTPWWKLISDVKDFRFTVESRGEPPHHSLLRLLENIDIDEPAREWYKSNSSFAHNDSRSPAPVRDAKQPFYELLRALNAERRAEMEYIPTMLQRYEEAGGFLIPTRARLYALLLVDEEKRAETKQRRREAEARKAEEIGKLERERKSAKRAAASASRSPGSSRHGNKGVRAREERSEVGAMGLAFSPRSKA